MKTITWFSALANLSMNKVRIYSNSAREAGRLNSPKRMCVCKYSNIGCPFFVHNGSGRNMVRFAVLNRPRVLKIGSTNIDDFFGNGAELIIRKVGKVSFQLKIASA